MAGPRPDAFQQALKRFKDNLHPSLINQFSVCTLQDVQDACRDIQATHGRQNKLRHMRRLEGFIEAMEQFGKVIELFVNANEVVSFVWGPIKFLLGIASTYTESFDKLLDAYGQIGSAIPGLMRYQAVFEKHSPLATVLEDYYSDILAFHQAALVVFKRPKWKDLFHSTWKTFNSKFGPILQSLSKRRELLESEKGSATLYEIQKLRDDLADVNAQQKQRTAQEAAEKHKQNVASIREKLEAPDYWIDQEMSTEDRLGTNSGMWIFEDSKFSHWVRDDVAGHRVLYVNGIPGAGKTTLISAVIARLLDGKYAEGNKPCIVYFYFKQKQPTKESYNSLLRAILKQIIDRDPTMCDHIFEEVSSVEGVNLRSTNKLQMLVKTALESYSISYIVLDGLDECAPTEGEKSINWFLSLTNGGLQEANARLRVLFCGQRDATLEKLLANQPSVSLETSRHNEDIREYCRNFCKRIQEKFEISETMEEDIVQRVTNQAQGMFLYARVVLENLLNQTKLSGLRKEMEPGNFPEGIQEAYERVAVRIFQRSSMAEREDAIKILGWITCARRLLRWREIQALFCIDPVKEDVDYEERRLRVTCKELCSSLVDVHHAASKKLGPEDIIKIVHETAREYLFRRNWINIITAHAQMSIFCSRYLTSQPFLAGINKEDIIMHTVAGYYSLQDYAVQYWFEHLRQCIKTPETLPSDQLREVLETSRGFFEAYGLQSKMPVYQGTSTYEEIISILKKLPEDGRERNAYFTIEFQTTLIRNTIESIDNEKLKAEDRYVLLSLHGEGPSYKCTKPWCEYFMSGFANAEDRKQHTNRHNLPFRCPFETCFTHQLGFDTEAKLSQHKKMHHPEPTDDRIVFPKMNTTKTDFWRAIELGDLATVVRFLDSGKRVDKVKKESLDMITPLQLAAKHGHLELCKLLIKRGVGLEMGTSLILAAEAGHFDVCKLLLEKGAYVNFVNTLGRTALHGAVAVGSLHVVDLLIKQSAYMLDVFDVTGVTPFFEACKLGHLDIVKLLVETGKVRVDKHLKQPLQHDHDPIPPLASACIQGHFPVAQYLLQQGHPESVTWYLIAQTRQEGHGAIVDLLRPVLTKTPLPPLFELKNLPDSFKKVQSDWSVFYNPAIPRVLEIELVHTDLCTAVKTIQFSPDGKYLAVGCVGVVVVYDVIRGEFSATFRPTSNNVKENYITDSVCFSPDGKYIAAGGNDVSIHVWEYDTRALHSVLLTHRHINSLQFSQHGPIIVCGTADGVQLWNINTGIKLRTFNTKNVITSVSISRDKRYVVASLYNNRIALWDVENGSQERDFVAHTEYLNSIAFLPNGRLVSCSWDKTVKLWEISATPRNTGQGPRRCHCIKTFLHRDRVFSFGFTPDQWLLSSSKGHGIAFWDVHTGQPQLILQGHKEPIQLLASSPAGGYFATWSEPIGLRIWSYKQLLNAPELC